MYLNKIKIINAFICTLIIFSGCYDENDYYYSAADIFNNLKVEISSDSVKADGNSTVKITYSFPIEYDTNLTSLDVSATNGLFLESSNSFITTNVSKLDSKEDSRYSEITLVSSTKVANCIVTTRLMNYERKDTLIFTNVYPNNISLSTIPFYIKNDSIQEINITALLSSNNGLASIGSPVFFHFSPQIGLLDMQSSTSDSKGNAKFTYVFKDNGFVGEVIFIAKTLKENGDTLSATSSLIVID